MKKSRKIMISLFIATLVFSLTGLAGYAREADTYSVTIHWENSEGWSIEELQKCIQINGEIIQEDRISVNDNDIHIIGLTKEDQISFRPAFYAVSESGEGVQGTTVIALEEEITVVELEDEEVPLANVHLYNNLGMTAQAGFAGNHTMIAAIGMSLLGITIVICIAGLFTLTGHRKKRDEYENY